MSTIAQSDICWRLVLPDGTDYDQGDGVPHFGTEKEATERSAADESMTGAKAVKFAAPCVTVSCNGCDIDVGGEDVFTQVHLADIADAHRVARKSDWTVTPNDGTYCTDCVPGLVPDA